MSVELARVISWKLPTALFSWDHDPALAGLAGLDWKSVDVPKPTVAEVAQWQAEYEAAGGLRDQRARRIAEDVIVKALARACWEEVQKCQVKAGQTLLDANGFRDRIRVLVGQLLT